MLEAYSPAQLSFFLFQCLEPEIIHCLNFLLLHHIKGGKHNLFFHILLLKNEKTTKNALNNRIVTVSKQVLW